MEIQALATAPKVVELAPEKDRVAVYCIESRTTPHTFYIVRCQPMEKSGNDTWSCQCIASVVGRSCWHLDYIRSAHYRRRYQRTEAAQQEDAERQATSDDRYSIKVGN